MAPYCHSLHQICARHPLVNNFRRRHNVQLEQHDPADDAVLGKMPENSMMMSMSGATSNGKDHRRL